MRLALFTTPRLLQHYYACPGRYGHLVHALGPKWGDEQPIQLLRILRTNGLEDALWALRAVPREQRAWRDRISRLLGADYAERVLPVYERRHPDDDRLRRAIEVTRRRARGRVSATDLLVTTEAAMKALKATADSTEFAVATAVYHAGRTVAYAAAWIAAEPARRARGVAWEAEYRWQAQRLRAYLTGKVG